MTNPLEPYGPALAIKPEAFAHLFYGTQATTREPFPQVAVDYSGVGILSELVMAEVSGEEGPARMGLRLTVDGQTLYDNPAFLATKSSLRALLASIVHRRSPESVWIHGTPHGITFLERIRIEYGPTDGEGTCALGWRIAKTR